MNWTTNVNLLFNQLREFARFKDDSTIRDVVVDGSPELTVIEYDNWNGGTTSYALTIHVPAHVFAAREDDLERAEAKILEWVKRLLRSETNDFVTDVYIQPSFSSESAEIPVVETPFWLPGHFKC